MCRLSSKGVCIKFPVPRLLPPDFHSFLIHTYTSTLYTLLILFFKHFLLKFRRRRRRKKIRICARLRYAPFWKTVTRMQLAWDSYNLIVINYSVLVPHFIETIPLVFSVAWEQTAEYRMHFWNTAPRFDLIYLCACLTVGAAQSTLAKLISAQKHQNCSWSAHLCELDHSYSQKNLQGVCSRM